MTMRNEKPLRDYKKLGKNELRSAIRAFFDQAQEAKDLVTANALVRRAQKIILATRARLPKELTRRMCKNCGAYLISGKNATIRTQRGKVVFRCLECKHISRVPYTSEKRLKREHKRSQREQKNAR